MIGPALILAVGVAAGFPDSTAAPTDEIVVTGSRTPELLLRTPAAISIANKDAFVDTRGISLKDGLQYMPGVFVQSRGGGQDVRVTIRGFGARGNGERSNAGNMRGIRILQDGLPLTEPDGRTSLDLVDLLAADRIEVSRSNASALYGNASGGVINLRSDLSFGSPFVEGLQRSGSFGYHREGGTVGFTAGFSRGTFSLTNSDYDGWRAHTRSTTTQAQLRMSVPLDERTRLRALVDGVTDMNKFAGALTAEQLAADPRQANPKFIDRDERRYNRVGRVGMTFDRELGRAGEMALAIYAEPKVLQRSERNRFRDFNRYHVGGSAVFTGRSQLGAGLQNRVSIGGDEAWQDGSILFYNLGPGGTRGPDLVANKREGANSAGGFVEEELLWKERWSARVAARYDAIRYVSEDHMDASLNARKVFSRWTPKASLAFLAGRHTTYVALGGGIEAPAFNEIDPPAPFDTTTSFNPFLEAMHSTTYEVGARGELGGGRPASGDSAGGGPTRLGRVHYDAALYWIVVENDIIPFDGGAYFFTAGESRRRGVEVGLDWSAARWLLLRGAGTFSQNEYVEYANDIGDFSGYEVAGLPNRTLAGAARVTSARGPWLEVALEDVGEYFADDANTARVAPYTILNATVGYARALGERTLRAFVSGNNLADRRHVASVFINGINGEYYEPGLPRNWSVGLTLGWR